MLFARFHSLTGMKPVWPFSAMPCASTRGTRCRGSKGEALSMRAIRVSPGSPVAGQGHCCQDTAWAKAGRQQRHGRDGMCTELAAGVQSTWKVIEGEAGDAFGESGHEAPESTLYMLPSAKGIMIARQTPKLPAWYRTAARDGWWWWWWWGQRYHTPTQSSLHEMHIVCVSHVFQRHNLLCHVYTPGWFMGSSEKLARLFLRCICSKRIDCFWVCFLLGGWEK